MKTLKAELEKILKNNKTLQLIQLQYEKEIDRRRTALNADKKECKHSPSPKKGHAYPLGVGGSPSPKRQNVVFDSNGKRIASPEKGFSPIKLKSTKLEDFGGKKVSLLLSSNAKKNIRQMDSGLFTPEKAIRKRTNTLNNTMIRKEISSIKKSIVGPIDEKAEMQKFAGK
jgi:hypothetical protein